MEQRELKLFEVGSGATQTQKLRICYRCSASLSIFDSDRRLADHFAGKVIILLCFYTISKKIILTRDFKMHLGFVKIRETLEELKAAGFGQERGSVAPGRDYQRTGEARPRDSRGIRSERRRSRSPPPYGRRGGRRF
jgi:hypothetical protein